MAMQMQTERVRRAEEELKAALEEERDQILRKETERLAKRAGPREATAEYDPATLKLAGEKPPHWHFDLDHLFRYHSPHFSDLAKYALIRQTAKYFAQIILDNTPPGADQSDAIRKLREAVMFANASIALDTTNSANIGR